MKKKKVISNSGVKEAINTEVARVSGASQAAGAAVSETMTIKDEALDRINRQKSPETAKKENDAIKKISSMTEHLKK